MGVLERRVITARQSPCQRLRSNDGPLASNDGARAELAITGIRRRVSCCVVLALIVARHNEWCSLSPQARPLDVCSSHSSHCAAIKRAGALSLLASNCAHFCVRDVTCELLSQNSTPTRINFVTCKPRLVLFFT